VFTSTPSFQFGQQVSAPVFQFGYLFIVTFLQLSVLLSVSSVDVAHFLLVVRRHEMHGAVENQQKIPSSVTVLKVEGHVKSVHIVHPIFEK